MGEGQVAKDSNVSQANREPSNHDESRAGKAKKRLTLQLMQISQSCDVGVLKIMQGKAMLLRRPSWWLRPGGKLNDAYSLAECSKVSYVARQRAKVH